MAVSNRDISGLRLAAQRLTGTRFSTPDEVVRHLLAIQAQDYNGALWSIGLRTVSSTKTDVEQAIIDRKIVRTWPMRGTLHDVHADDVHWLLELLAARATASARSRRINLLGLTDELVTQAETIIRTELKGGRHIIRGDIEALLRDAITDIEITGQHAQHLMRNFGERGVICFGPNEGKQPTIVLLDEWIPKTMPVSRPEALIELARRYVLSHGPVTLKDFSGWAMLTVADAKFALEGAQKYLEVVMIDDSVYYMAPGLKSIASSEPILLPGFDEYLLGYKDRGAVIAPEHANKIVPGGNGIFLPTIVVDGQVTGVWRRTIAKKSVKHAYEIFTGTLPDTTPCESRYERFLGMVS